MTIKELIQSVKDIPTDTEVVIWSNPEKEDELVDVDAVILMMLVGKENGNSKPVVLLTKLNNDQTTEDSTTEGYN